LCGFFVGHQQPFLKYLNRYVRDSIGIKWYDLGIELLHSNDVAELDMIEAEHPTDHKKCCTKMFSLWLRKQPAASWNQLVEALRQPGVELITLATNIEQILLAHKPKGTHSVHTHSTYVYFISILTVVSHMARQVTTTYQSICTYEHALIETYLVFVPRCCQKPGKDVKLKDFLLSNDFEDIDLPYMLFTD